MKVGYLNRKGGGSASEQGIVNLLKGMIIVSPKSSLHQAIVFHTDKVLETAWAIVHTRGDPGVWTFETAMNDTFRLNILYPGASAPRLRLLSGWVYSSHRLRPIRDGWWRRGLRPVRDGWWR